MSKREYANLHTSLKIASKCGLMAEIKMPCAKMCLSAVSLAQSVLLTPPPLRKYLQDKPRVFRTVTARWPSSTVFVVVVFVVVCLFLWFFNFGLVLFCFKLMIIITKVIAAILYKEI